MFSPSPAIAGASGPVMARHKDCGDGKQVFGELAGCIRLMFVENHEFCACLCEDDFKQLDSKPCQPIPVHNHNLLELSRQRELQNGLHSSAFEVDPGADIRDDSMGGEIGLQVLDLSLKVFSLVCATDPCVRNLLFGLGGVSASNGLFESISRIEALAGLVEANNRYPALVGPSAECGI